MNNFSNQSLALGFGGKTVSSSRLHLKVARIFIWLPMMEVGESDGQLFKIWMNHAIQLFKSRQGNFKFLKNGAN